MGKKITYMAKNMREDRKSQHETKPTTRRNIKTLTTHSKNNTKSTNNQKENTVVCKIPGVIGATFTY